MTIMKKVISSYQKNFCKLIGAWLAIGAFTTSCTNNNVISDEDKPTQQIYTLSVDADKDNATRSLFITDKGKLDVEWRVEDLGSYEKVIAYPKDKRPRFLDNEKIMFDDVKEMGINEVVNRLFNGFLMTKLFG